jgi:hypothetical protein
MDAWSLKACTVDTRTFKEIREYLLNLSHESIEVLQGAVVYCQAEIETNGCCFAANIEIQVPAAVMSRRICATVGMYLSANRLPESL